MEKLFIIKAVASYFELMLTIVYGWQRAQVLVCYLFITC